MMNESIYTQTIGKDFKSKTVIMDPVMMPYFLVLDEYCFSVGEVMAANPKHHLTKGKGKNSTKLLTFHTSISQALGKIIRNKLNDREVSTSLKDFLNKYRKITHEFKNILSQYESM